GGGRARGADPQVRQPRLLGDPRQLPGRSRRVPGQVVRPQVEEEPRGRRAPGRPGVVAGRGYEDRRRGARQASHRDGGVQADHAGLAAAVRPDLPAARGQRPLRLLGQDHAGPGAEPVRAAQGADLSADRFARAARGLPRHRQADHGHAGRQRHGPPGALREAGDRRQLRQAEQADLRQRQGQRPLRHHPDAAGAQRPVGRRAEAVRPGGAPLPVGVLPECGVHGDDAHHDRGPHACGQVRGAAPRGGSALGAARRRGGRWPQLQDRGQGAGQGRLAGDLGQGGRGRGRGKEREQQDAGGGEAGRAGQRPDRRCQGPEDPPAGALLRSHPARRHGRRRQDGGGRGTARGHAGKGPGHPGDPRLHHRGPDRREVHAARRPRADSHGQGLPADDAAARPADRGTLQARAHRRLGIQAGADGARQALARCVHAGNRRDDQAHRQEGQGVRPRHRARRLHHLEDAVPQLRRRGARELPPLHLPGPQGRAALRLLLYQDPGRPCVRAARGGDLPARQEDRPAGGLPLQGRLAVHRRDRTEVRRGREELEAGL
ncbi:MAG: DNA topoisomerase III, Burkholderia type, partial [uncultured Ramlibacter sp.]